jgi:outer membrane receptor for ferrienterochelin and colicins
MKYNICFAASFLSVFLFLCKTSTTYSHYQAYVNNGKVSGIITDKKTGQPIPDANIILKRSQYGTSSGDGGYYFIKNIPQGEYTITVSVIGYQLETKTEIYISKNTRFDFALTPAIIPMNPIIVTATQSDHMQYRVSASSEVYTLSRIKENNGYTAGEIIETASSLFVKDNGGLAGVKSLSIRGSDNSQILVLLDGQRLNSAQFAGFDLNAIPGDALERIEIVRGGNSALFGSDAIGGTVNLITRESVPSRGFSLGMRSTFGSYSTTGLHLSGTYQRGNLFNFVSYNHIKSNGNFSYTDPNTSEEKARENNDYKSNTIFIKSKLKFSHHGSLQFTYQNLESNRGISGSILWLSPQARRQEDRKLYSLRYIQQISTGLRVKAQTYFQNYSHSYQNPDSWPPADSHHKNRVAGFDAHALWTLGSHFIVTSGGGVRNDRVESTDIRIHRRTNQNLFLQTEINYTVNLFRHQIQWNWTPALRWDSYTDIGSQTCPKLGLLISSGQKTLIGFRGNISRSFRTPTFNDLYWPEDMFCRGNPGLKPEIGANFDFGLLFHSLQSSLFQMELTYFKNSIKNLIIWEPGLDWIWTPQNIGKATVAGLESTFTFRSPNNRFFFKIIHSWMKAKNNAPDSPDTGKQLIYRPDSKTDILTGFSIAPLRLNLNYRIISKRFTLSDNSSSIPGYSLLNGNVNLSCVLFGIAFDATLQMRNLLDKSISILEGYPIPGREIRFSLGFNY